MVALSGDRMIEGLVIAGQRELFAFDLLLTHRLAADRMPDYQIRRLVSARLMAGLCFQFQPLALLTGVFLLTFTFLSIFLFRMHFQVSLALVASRESSTADLASEWLLSGMGSRRERENEN